MTKTIRRVALFAAVLIPIGLALSLSHVALAQQATITTTVAPPAETKAVVFGLEMRRTPPTAILQVAFQSAAGGDLRVETYRIPADQGNPGTELATFAAALITPRSGETGSAPRKLNFRALGYLVDSGRLSGVTLQP